jgi:transcriptional regulator NrdR family protein
VVYDTYMKTQNKCQTCHRTKDLRINSKRITKDGSIKYNYLCKSCNTIRVKNYRHTEKGRDRQLAAIKNWESKNKEKIQKIRNGYSEKRRLKYYVSEDRTEYNKYKARWIFRDFRKANNIIPEKCVICSNSKVHAHHPDYSKPCVICWLCAVCHHKLHRGLVKVDEKLYNSYR